ncbi:hypothetical protein MSG28_002989 [Choristoneura fumiferana]|uniref:Uncharacterized protein n=1 Tax=Choristoneura fumiferana TaxID=7141 RepID=A0ACC0JKA8_CHOFU|nr:hypothetical protein MSG28_002989 [Choristoneura fumiferana]
MSEDVRSCKGTARENQIPLGRSCGQKIVQYTTNETEVMMRKTTKQVVDECKWQWFVKRLQRERKLRPKKGELKENGAKPDLEFVLIESPFNNDDQCNSLSNGFKSVVAKWHPADMPGSIPFKLDGYLPNISDSSFRAQCGISDSINSFKPQYLSSPLHNSLANLEFGYLVLSKRPYLRTIGQDGQYTQYVHEFTLQCQGKVFMCSFRDQLF